MTEEKQKDRSNPSHSAFGRTTGVRSFPNEAMVLWGSVICLAYFVTANFTGAYRADYPVIGVFIELFTIPAFLLAACCFVFSVILWARNQYNVFTRPFYALLFLLGLALFFIFIS
jgi:hypothetical protein